MEKFLNKSISSKILFLGVSMRTKGGMTAVLVSYNQYIENMRFIPTWKLGNKIVKVWYAIQALVRTWWLCNFDRNIQIVHIHGAANAMYLPKVIAFNAKDETAKKRYGVIADYMHLGGKDDDEKVELLIAYLRKMNDDLNIPHSINHYGADGLPAETGFVPEDVFLDRVEEIAANAIGDACTGSNPRIPTQEEMVKLLKACYYDTEVDF